MPAMVAAVQGVDGEICAVHRTYLRVDGLGKAGVLRPKMMLGSVKGRAVRLAEAGPRLAICEGIETGLSIVQAKPDLPVWAVLSVSNMGAVELPPAVREVVLCVDGDPPGSAADKAAIKAALAIEAGGRSVHIARPPEGTDFNDVLGLPGNVGPFEREVCRV